jgi:hypothetical protein
VNNTNDSKQRTPGNYIPADVSIHF